MVDAISQMPWDVDKEGPLVAAIPLSSASGPSLEDLGYRKATIGGLTAIVPKTMATVNSRFTTAPNLYEGMPQDAKMLYLLKSLSPAQWTKATADGIGIEDCQGEQRAVFDSIVPNPLRYFMGTVTENGIFNGGDPNAVKILPEGDRAKVKLRVVRHLDLHVSLENDRGWTATEPKDDAMKPGTKMPFLDEEKDSQFGHRIIVKGPNLPRKSHLDPKDSRFNAMIPLKTGERVADLLTRIEATTGIPFVADPHYAPMIMVERGTSATARDLLSALSLGVTGTYRRVGDTYVLTADLEGMGAHVARVALWEDTLKKIVDTRSRDWRQQIAKGGGFGKIQFRSATYDGLTEAEKANLEVNDHPNDRPTFIPLDQASTPIKQAITNWKYANKIDRNRVGVKSSIRYQIVLPGMGRTWWQGWLGNTEEFNSKPYTWAPPKPAPVAVPLDPQGAVSGLVLHAENPTEATAQVARVARLGIGELWLETRSAAALKAAVQAGAAASVKVCLTMRPWEVPAGTGGGDRTVTGERGRTLAATKQTIESWWNHWAELQAFEPPTRELMPPLDPATNPTIAQLSQLAQTPGLTKTVVLDLYPTGYSKEESNAGGGYWYSSALDAYLSYGYTEAMRVAYLKSERVDPIDLETQMVRTETQFGPAWGERFGSYSEGFAKWQKAKGKWNQARATALAQALYRANPTGPILMPGEPQIKYMPPLSTTYLYRWSGTGALPPAPNDFGGGPVPESTDTRVLDITDERDPDQRNRVADRLKEMIEQRKCPIVLDLSSVPSQRLEAVLAYWLRTRK